VNADLGSLLSLEGRTALVSGAGGAIGGVVGSGAGEPLLLTETLAEMAARFCDIEVIHLTTAQEESKLADPALISSFVQSRHGVILM